MGNEIFKGDRIRRDQQLVFLNNTQLNGIQSFSASYSLNEQPLKFIGGIHTPNILVPNGPQQGNASINALLIDNDPFVGYTGQSGFNIIVLNSRNNISGNYSLTSGYITSYSSRCGIGEIPQMAVGITVLGDIGRLNSGESMAFSGQLVDIQNGISEFIPKIAGPGSIEISLNDFNTNRVMSYELNIETPRNVIYAIGNRRPTRVEINYPIVVNALFEFESDDYRPNNLRAFPCAPKSGDLTLNLKQFNNNNIIQSFAFSGMTLAEENYDTNLNGNTRISARYKKYINRPSGTF